MWESTRSTTLPPRPPSPPSGPPAATYFSRWKETAPPPPLPARTVMRAVSMNWLAIVTSSQRDPAGAGTALCAVQVFLRSKNLGAGRIYFARAFGKRGPRAAVSPSGEDPAGAGTARMRPTKVFAQRTPRRRANFFCPSRNIRSGSGGGRAAWGKDPVPDGFSLPGRKLQMRDDKNRARCVSSAP